jgi:O-antigen/teichoic acid export membrane protein
VGYSSLFIQPGQFVLEKPLNSDKPVGFWKRARASIRVLSMAGLVGALLWRALLRHRSQPLYRNAYYLLASIIVTSLLGFVFWMLAARLYPVGDVGLASAGISAMSLLAIIAEPGLGASLIRFLPKAGKNSVGFINSSITVSGLFSLVIAGVFIAGIGLWSPALAFLRDNVQNVALFLGFTVAWTVYNLVDQTFMAVSSAGSILIKNTVSDGIKLVFVAVFAALSGGLGILVSTGLGVVIGVLLAVLWLLPRAHPGYRFMPTFKRHFTRETLAFSAGNYLAGLLWVAPTMFLPLLVVNTMGGEMNAYFFVAWSIASLVYAIPRSFSQSLFAEGSAREESLLHDAKRTLVYCLLIFLPVFGIVFLLGGRILLVFGKEYSENAKTLLWLLTLSAVPVSINYIFIAIMRVRKEIKKLNIACLTIFVVGTGLSYILMKTQGLLGVAYGWVAGQTLVAVIFALPVVVRRPVSRSGNADGS